MIPLLTHSKAQSTQLSQLPTPLKKSIFSCNTWIRLPAAPERHLAYTNHPNPLDHPKALPPQILPSSHVLKVTLDPQMNPFVSNRNTGKHRAIYVLAVHEAMTRSLFGDFSLGTCPWF